MYRPTHVCSTAAGRMTILLLMNSFVAGSFLVIKAYVFIYVSFLVVWLCQCLHVSIIGYSGVSQLPGRGLTEVETHWDRG